MSLLAVFKHRANTYSLRFAQPHVEISSLYQLSRFQVQVLELSPVGGLQMRKLSSIQRQYGFCPLTGTLSRPSRSKSISCLLAPAQSFCLPATRVLPHVLCLISVFAQLSDDALFNFHLLMSFCPDFYLHCSFFFFFFWFLINHPSESLLKSG